jgi:hypothetical protein
VQRPAADIDPAQVRRLIEINARPAVRCEDFATKREICMSTNEIAFLALALGAMSLLAGVLGWATWMEYRARKSAPER